MKDRDYYVDADPSHQEFKTFVAPILEEAVVVDYSEGVFQDFIEQGYHNIQLTNFKNPSSLSASSASLLCS